MNFQGELSERYSVASESGSSTDSHAETPENKDGESLLSFLFFSFCAELVQNMGLGTWCSKNVLMYCMSFPLHSKEKIRCRFEVQQPHEHRQEKTLVIREPREMCGHLR